MNYFNQCQTLQELKTAYKKLAMIHHPDRGGSLEEMKLINAEYDEVFRVLKDAYNKDAKPGRETTEVPEQFRDIIIDIMDLEGIEIELIGSWIWVSGDTRTHKDLFKGLGFNWASKKKMWYWRVDEYKSFGRGKKSIQEIRDTYGSEKLVMKKNNRIGG